MWKKWKLDLPPLPSTIGRQQCVESQLFFIIWVSIWCFFQPLQMESSSIVYTL
jgi:hypothetical protein